NQGVSPADLLTTYPFDTGATSAWTATKPITGAGVGIAVLDTGVDANHPDLKGHVTAINVNPRTQTPADTYGHGTHVLGIAGGLAPDGNYIGVAPLASLVSVKIADDQGVAYESDVLRGLDWVQRNGPAFKVKVVSMSLSTSIPTSYATSPIDAAVERLWAS